ncbi:hypothetical protein TRFO_10360 [Tritrichomonas foetus]|uniref:Uncharacterized protein n=1 Tax=Tritrichomonas foetus TaxID=1144522 RepID=A0A1J4JE53_9EUKA|nr:hypothetical protein TRFO_10360 [Tritrichomonas foetus]|eukprot:OHS95717.1 hypothetical protein TRFO_10360 [Tritrichomonas foetus]
MDYNQAFLYSDRKFSESPSTDSIHIHSSDAKVYVCHQFPQLAYFQINPTHINEWCFFANDEKISCSWSKCSSTVPFFKLEYLENNADDYHDKYSEISHFLFQNFEKWFHESNDENDLMIMFKIVSTNFIFNHFTSYFLKQYNKNIRNKNNNVINNNHKNIKNNEEKTTAIDLFKYFILNVRPNGKPNQNPLFELTNSLFFFLIQVLNTDLYNQYPNFLNYGIKYILDYLLNDNEWGPYSAISFIVKKQNIIPDILPFPMLSDLNINSEVFFSQQNLKCIEMCISLFGIDCLIWSYNSSFHNQFLKLSFEFQTMKGIPQNQLKELIKNRVSNSRGASINDISNFFDFILDLTNIEQVSLSELFCEVSKDMNPEINELTDNNEQTHDKKKSTFQVFCSTKLLNSIQDSVDDGNWMSRFIDDDRFSENEDDCTYIDDDSEYDDDDEIYRKRLPLIQKNICIASGLEDDQHQIIQCKKDIYMFDRKFYFDKLNAPPLLANDLHAVSYSFNQPANTTYHTNRLFGQNQSEMYRMWHCMKERFGYQREIVESENLKRITRKNDFKMPSNYLIDRPTIDIQFASAKNIKPNIKNAQYNTSQIKIEKNSTNRNIDTLNINPNSNMNHMPTNPLQKPSSENPKSELQNINIKFRSNGNKNLEKVVFISPDNTEKCQININSKPNSNPTISLNLPNKPTIKIEKRSNYNNNNLILAKKV